MMVSQLPLIACVISQDTMYKILSIFCFFAALGTAVAADTGLAIRGVGPSAEAPHGNGNVYGAEIVRHGDNYLMYYGGQGRDGHDRIHLATSQDGHSWTPIGVVFAPDGINHVNDPSVVIVNQQFYMYYTLANAGVTDTIGLAMSSDGRKWKDYGSVLSPRGKPKWDSLLVGRPSVIHNGNRYRMWFDGRADLPIGAPDANAPQSATSQRYVGYAESKDGVNWETRDDYVFANDAGGVHVSRVNDELIMLIESRHGTKYATSNDGISWRDRGLLVAKDNLTSPHGHVTPFLFSSANRHLLYFGAAQSEHWNRNSIMRQPVILPSEKSER
jgi:predicted GH43/DUF377 family glycosyl hydrolase